MSTGKVKKRKNKRRSVTAAAVYNIADLCTFLALPLCRPSKGKGSRTKPIPEEVNRKLGEATLHYASGR